MKYVIYYHLFVFKDLLFMVTMLVHLTRDRGATVVMMKWRLMDQLFMTLHL